MAGIVQDLVMVDLGEVIRRTTSKYPLIRADAYMDLGWKAELPSSKKWILGIASVLVSGLDDKEPKVRLAAAMALSKLPRYDILIPLVDSRFADAVARAELNAIHPSLFRSPGNNMQSSADLAAEYTKMRVFYFKYFVRRPVKYEIKNLVVALKHGLDHAEQPKKQKMTLR